MSAIRSQLRLAATAVLLVVALVACVRVPPLVVPQGPIVLAVVTWNMNAGRGDLARLIDDLSSGRLTDGSTSNFVLALQEATRSSALDTLAAANARKLAVFFEPVYSNPARTSGNALVSTVPLGDTRAIALPRERQPRAAVAATVEIAGQRLFVVSVHLENRISWLRFGLFADRARGRQAEALVAGLPTGHGVVGGDMNTTLGPNEPAWKILLKRFPDTPRAMPEPTFRDRLVLDHVFFDLPDGWLAARTVLSDRYGSDHHPVVGTIRLAPKAVEGSRAAADLGEPPSQADEQETPVLEKFRRFSFDGVPGELQNPAENEQTEGVPGEGRDDERRRPEHE